MLTKVLIISGVLLSVVFLMWFFISDKHFSKIAVLFMDAAVIILSVGTITAGLFLRNQFLNEDMKKEIEGQEEILLNIEETDEENPGALSPVPLGNKEPWASPSETPLGDGNRQDAENGDENKDQTETQPIVQTQPTVQDIPENNGDSQGAEAPKNTPGQPQGAGGENIPDQSQPAEGENTSEQTQATEGENIPAPAQPAAEDNAAGAEGSGTSTGQEAGAGEENSQPGGANQTGQNALPEGNGQEPSGGQAADESLPAPEAGQPGDAAVQAP